MNNINNMAKSATEIADEEKKKKEQEAREKEAERQRIAKQAEAIACKFVRIAGSWYKKCQNVDGEWVLERYSAADIVADYGKKLGPAIMAAAPKCINRVNMPEHIGFREFISTASGDVYFNTYQSLKYQPLEGEWIHIESLVRHIFGEQYELGLDFLELMYLSPKTRLPILVLVSSENGTGKSTFCNFLREVFGDNAKAITRDTLDSRFNSSWATKLLAYVEETFVESRALIEKIKNYATAEVVPTERKGYDMANEKAFIKLIMCSNDEIHPTIIDKEDTRHWVRKVPVITNNLGKDFLEECKKEIPAFLHFLQNREMITAGTKRDRLWFWHDEIVTDAWRRIMACSQEKIERELVLLLKEIMTAMNIEEVMYSATELNCLIQNVPTISDYEKRRCDRLKVRDILRKWGLQATKENRRHDLYGMNCDGTVRLVCSRSSNVYVITKELLKNWDD